MSDCVYPTKLQCYYITLMLLPVMLMTRNIQALFGPVPAWKDAVALPPSLGTQKCTIKIDFKRRAAFTRRVIQTNFQSKGLLGTNLSRPISDIPGVLKNSLIRKTHKSVFAVKPTGDYAARGMRTYPVSQIAGAMLSLTDLSGTGLLRYIPEAPWKSANVFVKCPNREV